MTVKLYGFPYSTATQAVALVLKELKIPYEVILVDVAKGEHKTDEYLASNQPFGQVPFIVDDDGFKLYESRAIARYFVEKHAPNSGLIPKDLKKKALFEQAASIEVTDFNPFAVGFIQEKLVKPRKGLEPNDHIVAEVVKKLEENLKAYERILSKQKYLAGDELTLADLLHIPAGFAITAGGGFTGLTASPNVARWWNDISSRATWKDVSEGLEKFANK